MGGRRIDWKEIDIKVKKSGYKNVEHYLTETYPRNHSSEIATFLGVSVPSLHSKANSLNIHKMSTMSENLTPGIQKQLQERKIGFKSFENEFQTGIPEYVFKEIRRGRDYYSEDSKKTIKKRGPVKTAAKYKEDEELNRRINNIGSKHRLLSSGNILHGIVAGYKKKYGPMVAITNSLCNY